MLSFIFSSADPKSEENVLIVIERGDSGAKLADFLEKKGVISNSRRFIWAGRILGKWNKIKSGEYGLSANMTPLEIFKIITSGISLTRPITVPEGTNMYQIAAELERKSLTTAAEFLALCKDTAFITALGFSNPIPKSLEGYLYPDTYFFDKTLKPRQMVTKMVQRFFIEWDDKRLQRAKELGMTRHQVVVLASIIEKETGAPQERPLISSVFHNRLNKGMRLQSDPTTIYGMWETFHGNIKKEHLLIKNNYNTYAMGGLPIGPIANPGKEAILAALFPEQSNYLYFVSKNDGTHVFSKNLEDHQRAVHQFQQNRSARAGKSWRDLKKQQTNQPVNP